jgi:predicted amidophosphoribosyltransferase
LDISDTCLFLGEYTARKGFSFSATNHLVLNFKKSVDRRGRPEWQHKERAIREVGQAFATAVKAEWLATATLVPIPPSKEKNDPLYDDRMQRMLRAIPAAQPLDIRELLIQQQTMEAAHDADVRPGPDQIAASYQIDENLCETAPNTIALFDDVITTGAHFVAARRLLQLRFPQARIIGFFIARRVPETTDFSAFFEDLDDK